MRDFIRLVRDSLGDITMILMMVVEAQIMYRLLVILVMACQAGDILTATVVGTAAVVDFLLFAHHMRQIAEAMHEADSVPDEEEDADAVD